METHRENLVDTYNVYLSATIEESFSQAVPMAGDMVFDVDGEEIGRVLSAETREESERLLLTVKCRMKMESPERGEEILLETPDCIRYMRVISFEKTEQKGR